MGIWKAAMGRVREEKKKEERRSKYRKSQKKEDPGARKGRKVAKHCVFQMICGSGGSKSRLAKAPSAEPSGQMRDKSCTPLWRKTCFQVKMYKAHQGRTTFGSWDVEKVHAIVARSTFRSQNVQNTSVSDHFWKLWCRKSARRCGVKNMSKSKCTKHTMLGPLFEVDMSKKVYAVVARSTFPSRNVKNTTCSDHCWRFRCRFAWQAQGIVQPCQKWAEREGFVIFPKTMAGVGHVKRIWKDAFRVAGVVQKTCSSEMLGGQGADFLRGVAFWSIRSSGLLRWFARQVQHFVWPGITFTWQAQHFRQMKWKNHKNALVRGRQLCTQLSIFEGTLAEFLRFWCCQLQKIEDVSQNCFVFDIVKFKNWGSLAELLRFWCCQVQKLRKSRRIASFSSLQIGKTNR